MIHEVDEALRRLLRAALPEGSGEVVFEAPNRDWAARRNAPTLNSYLYDIREDVARRERGAYAERGPDGVVLRRRQPPRWFRLSYLLTAWTNRPEDEHRLLSAALGALLAHELLPPDRCRTRSPRSGCRCRSAWRCRRPSPGPSRTSGRRSAVS